MKNKNKHDNRKNTKKTSHSKKDKYNDEQGLAMLAASGRGSRAPLRGWRQWASRARRVSTPSVPKARTGQRRLKPLAQSIRLRHFARRGAHLGAGAGARVGAGTQRGVCRRRRAHMFAAQRHRLGFHKVFALPPSRVPLQPHIATLGFRATLFSLYAV